MFEAILVFTKDGRNQPLNIIPFLCKAQDCEIVCTYVAGGCGGEKEMNHLGKRFNF